MSIANIAKYKKSQQIRENLRVTQAMAKYKTVPTEWADFARLLTIQSGDKFTKYEPYDYQIELDKAFEKYPTVIGVKSRQLGWTTYSASKGLHKALLNPAYTAIYISRTQSDASLIAYTVRQMLLSIPDYGKSVNDNLMIQRVSGGGTLHFRSPGPNATRGIPSVSDIFIDEGAFIENVEMLYGQIKNTQSMVGDKARTLIISTPNTVTDWFYERLTEGTPEILEMINQVRKGEIAPVQVYEDKKSGWGKFICHWKAHPIYSQYPDYLERCAQRDQIPVQMVYRERDLSFEDNTLNVFPYQLVADVCCIPKYTREYIEDYMYYIGVDTAGVGDDYFVATVFEKEDGEIYKLVDIYRNQSGDTNLHLFEVSKLIRKYKPFRVSIETNGGGQTYFDLLSEDFPSTRFNKVHTSQSTKANMISKMLYMMQRKRLKLTMDRAVSNELLSYQKDGEKYGAVSGKHDDIVMSIALALNGISYILPQNSQDS